MAVGSLCDDLCTDTVAPRFCIGQEKFCIGQEQLVSLARCNRRPADGPRQGLLALGRLGDEVEHEARARSPLRRDVLAARVSGGASRCSSGIADRPENRSMSNAWARRTTSSGHVAPLVTQSPDVGRQAGRLQRGQGRRRTLAHLHLSQQELAQVEADRGFSPEAEVDQHEGRWWRGSRAGCECRRRHDSSWTGIASRARRRSPAVPLQHGASPCAVGRRTLPPRADGSRRRHCATPASIWWVTRPSA